MGQTEEHLRVWRWRFFPTVRPKSFLKFISLLMELRRNKNEYKLQLDTVFFYYQTVFRNSGVKSNNAPKKRAIHMPTVFRNSAIHMPTVFRNSGVKSNNAPKKRAIHMPKKAPKNSLR